MKLSFITPKMDGLGNKIKLDSKTIMILSGVGLVVMIGIFVFFATAFKPEAPQTETQNVVTKNESKTYSKYIALKEDQVSSPTPSALPSTTPSPSPTIVKNEASESSPSPTLALNEGLTLTPEPTEIILAVGSPTTTPEAVATTNEPTQLAALPTTGAIEGGLLIFLVSISMIAFAFVL